MAAKRVVTLATEDFVLKLVNDLKEGFPTEKFNELTTNNKTIPGAINEVNALLDIFKIPDYDVSAQMYYGIIDPKEVGTISSFKDITFDMLNDNFISTKPGERTSVPLGRVEQGQLIVIALPVIFDLVATKDDGFGGATAFDDSILGANGVDIMLNGQDYMVFGEFVLVSGNRYININKRKPIEGCQCPPITDYDIDDIIDTLE